MEKITSFFMSLIMFVLSLFGIPGGRNKRPQDPTGFSTYTAAESKKADNADYYVATDGNDDNDGSFNNPFATLERARAAVRGTDRNDRDSITVAVKAGDYRVSGFEFTSEDSGTESCQVIYTSYGDGEVVLNGGVTLDNAGFTAVTDTDVLKRMSADAKENVRCISLDSVGISIDDYGKMYAIGTYNTAYKYTGDWTGPLYCELFMNDRRMTIARYPNDGYLYTGKVVKTGQGLETDGNKTRNPDWYDINNPESDVYAVSDELAGRIASWKTLDDVWMFGYFKYDWADSSSPIGEFSAENKTLSPRFVSLFGTKENAPYYFYNVFEELDSPGEWYLDRVNNVLYMYPDGNISEAVVDLSLTNDNIVCGNVDNLTINGFTFKGTRGDAINISGNNNTISECLVKNVAGNAIIVNGYNNLVARNEITRTGKGGIYITGGDRETLTPGNNKADNNLIHDWSEIYQTYQPAVTVSGVGNICSHNEMYNSPHEAITYGGNNNIIEYNLIHDVCLLTDDGGAIYSGRRWDYYGNVIRYNCIYDLGSGGFTPDGIYMDDALSGQTIYGNLLVNVPKIGIHLGGGRDLDVRNNIIINTTYRPISYDQRAIDGVNGGWFTFGGDKNDTLWQTLYESPYKTELWRETYPQMTKFYEEFDDIDNPDFIPNPSYSTVTGNLILNADGKIGEISKCAQKFSTVENNAVYRMTKINSIFTSPETGDYSLKENSPVYKKIPGFENIPVNEIGRY